MSALNDYSRSLPLLVAATGLACLLPTPTSVLAGDAEGGAGTTLMTGRRAYGLEEILLMTLENNLDLKVEQRAPLIREARIEGARGEFDPTLNITSVYEDRERAQNTQEAVATDGIDIFSERNLLLQGSLGGKLGPGTEYELIVNGNRLENSLNARDISRFRPEYESDIAFTITQPLFKDFGFEVNKARIRIAESDLKQSRLELRTRVLEVAAQVMDAYTELAFAQDNVSVKRDAIELAGALLAENQRRLEVGVMKPIDVIEAEVAVSEAEEALITAEAFLIERRNTLKSLIFKDYRDVAELVIEAADPVTAETPPLGDKSGYFTRALEQNPEYLRQKEVSKQEDIRYQYARNQVKPRIDLRGTLGWNGLGDEFGSSVSDWENRKVPAEWAAGLVITYPLGNRTAKAQLEESQIRREQADLGIRYLENTIAASVDTAIERIKANLRRLSTTDKLVEQAKAALEAEQRRLETGVGTSYDARRSQAELSNARTRRLAAIAEVEKSVTALHRVVGWIPELDEHVEWDWTSTGSGRTVSP